MKNTALLNLAALLLCLAALPGCVSITSGPQHITHNNATPTSGGFNMISLEEEIALGHREFAKVKAQKPRTRDASKQQTAQRVLNRLIAANKLQNAYPWEIIVFADNTPNAFALPGGKIGIHDGIFKYTKNDDGLAAVIAHEMVHITARHATQRVSRQMTAGIVSAGLASIIAGGDPNMAQGLGQIFGMGANVGVVLPYSREAEFEADRIGVLYMARAGYDPKESVKVWRRFEKSGGSRPPQWLSTHPYTSERIRQIEMNMPRYLSVYNSSRS
jgi:predicted Zn-dependent protease